MAIPAILVPVIVWAVKALSDEARKALQTALQGWYVHALATPNKVDDVAAKILCILLSVDVSSVPQGPNNVPVEVVDAVVGGMIEVATGRPFDPPGNELGGA
jgi:hypothetical protein